MTEREIVARAKNFWRFAARIEPFPRSLEPTVAWVLPLAVVKLPKLGLFDLHDWLARRDIPFCCDISDRRLRACLLGKMGRGIIFLDGSDPEDERRFSLAHEVAHFLIDYHDPRQKALAVLGESGREVLDGERPPTLEERLTGILQHVELGTFTHLMDRLPTGDVGRIDILAAEDNADRFAIELLAPREIVITRLEEQGIQWAEEAAFKAIQKTLIQEFGLPSRTAEEYGRMVVMGRRPARSFREWLGA